MITKGDNLDTVLPLDNREAGMKPNELAARVTDAERALPAARPATTSYPNPTGPGGDLYLNVSGVPVEFFGDLARAGYSIDWVGNVGHLEQLSEPPPPRARAGKPEAFVCANTILLPAAGIMLIFDRPNDARDYSRCFQSTHWVMRTGEPGKFTDPQNYTRIYLGRSITRTSPDGKVFDLRAKR